MTMANIHVAQAIQAERLRAAARIPTRDADSPTRRLADRDRRTRRWQWRARPARPCPTC